MTRSHTHQNNTQKRELIVVFSFVLALLVIAFRFYYWQIIQASDLKIEADNQYERTQTTLGSRGEIFTADNYPLVTNEPVYRLFANPQAISLEPTSVAKELAQVIADQQLASASGRASLESEIATKLSNPDIKWVSLSPAISEENKKLIENLKINGLGFDAYERRAYPEASLGAHLTGFVGKDSEGRDVGYFGLEGALEKELQARKSTKSVLTDAKGLQLINSEQTQLTPPSGRTVTTTIRRDVQFVIEEYLREGIEKYGAKSGEVVVMEPATGKILGMASFPSYEQSKFFEYPTERYKNPIISDLYEPGSTFKVLTVASGIDSGKITPNTTCTRCYGPRVFGKYTIRTWNDVYNPGISIEQGLAKSDNTAMIFIAELLGRDKFSEYLKKFLIGEPLNIDLQEDASTPFPKITSQVQMATISFGQGVAVNSLQLLRAVGAIANGGELIRPTIVESVFDPATGETTTTPVVSEGRAVKPQAATTVTKMMITSAESGEAQWTASKTHQIAGKTGTSQIAVGGKYDESKTIASFIGFSPPNNPKFIMLVKLSEPSSSPWAAETAAPLWYKIADKLFLLLNIPPDANTGSQ